MADQGSASAQRWKKAPSQTILGEGEVEGDDPPAASINGQCTGFVRETDFAVNLDGLLGSYYQKLCRFPTIPITGTMGRTRCVWVSAQLAGYPLDHLVRRQVHWCWVPQDVD